MTNKNKRIKEIREEIINQEQKEFKQKVAIVYDGKQYNIRIPKALAEKAKIDTEQDEFEFILELPKDKTELPSLTGDLVEKENID